jgi:hypothetical protein
MLLNGRLNLDKITIKTVLGCNQHSAASMFSYEINSNGSIKYFANSWQFYRYSEDYIVQNECAELLQVQIGITARDRNRHK